MRRRAGVLALLPMLALSGCDVSAPGQSASASETCRLVDDVVPLPIDLIESSGAAFSVSSPGIVWSHNDSGGEAELFAVDARGRLVARVAVTGAINEDWEDISLGPCAEGRCLYIGDIGDNEAARSEIVVYVVTEPSVGERTTSPARRYAMRYPEGPRDAESLFVMPDGDLFIVTKGGESRIELYRYPAPLEASGIATLELVQALSATPVPLADQVTAADADANWVVLRTYISLLAYRAEDLLGAAEASPISVDLRSIAEGQGEGIALGADGSVALTSEGFPPDLAGVLTLLQCPFLSNAG